MTSMSSSRMSGAFAVPLTRPLQAEPSQPVVSDDRIGTMLRRTHC